MSRKTVLSYALIFLAALLPRAVALDAFLTGDEANFWIHRSHTFLDALRAHDWAATAISTHPGVTTMWLGAAGIVMRETLFDWGLLGGVDFGTALTFFRLPPVLAHVAGVLLGYWMLRRLLPLPLATLAALLWATDPLFVGYSRLLHVDALAGTFATLSLLALCCYHYPGQPEGPSPPGPPWPRRHPGWLILSGVMAGLAFLSKSPALALIPAVALATWLADWRRGGSPWPQARTLASLAAWGLASAATVFALWPALWGSPLEAYAQLRLGVLAEGAQPHMTGNFFLGGRDKAPGLAYYMIALPLHQTPWGLVGLLALPVVWSRSRELRPGRPALAALAGFAVLFIGAMSLFPKKLDRYLIPTAPALSILAAAGLMGLAELSAARGARWARPALAGAVAALAVANLAWWHPYSLIAYNQLLGGAPAGARTFKLGMGEGMEQVAGWLNQQPDITGVAVTAERVTTLNPFLRPGAQADIPAGEALHRDNGYVVVYVSQVQGGPPGPPFSRFYGRATPLHTIRIHGVDYAWIYQVPPPVARKRPANFGPAIELRGFDQSAPARRGQTLSLRLVWEALARPQSDYWLFAHLVGPDGRRYAQVDQPYPTSQWAPGRFITAELPLPIPADLPQGTFRLLMGLYDPSTGQRLDLGGASGADPAIDGPDVLELLALTPDLPALTPPASASP